MNFHVAISPNPKVVILVSKRPAERAGCAGISSRFRPASTRVLTIFHFLIFFGVGIGFLLGLAVGTKLYGIAGGITGALIGGYAGFVVGGLPEFLVIHSFACCLARKTSAELRTFLRSPGCQIPNLILLELQRRGEDVWPELEAVVELLVAEEVGRRGCGWAALASAFPDLAAQLNDYCLGDSVAECRRKTSRLRRDRRLRAEA
jgi:hypothetical protein